jgi:methylmalonyl-CoA mutase N-terminal domain/subunit
MGGSWYVESLTDALDERASGLMKDIDDMGGMIVAIDRGFPQREIERAAWEYQKSIESGDRRIVGVNAYDEGGEADAEVFRIDPEVEREQVAALHERRADRDQGLVDGILGALQEAAESDENLFPHILEAVRAGATIGEICSALSAVFGRYRDGVAR